MHEKSYVYVVDIAAGVASYPSMDMRRSGSGSANQLRRALTTTFSLLILSIFNNNNHI